MVLRQLAALLMTLIWKAKSDCHTAASVDQVHFPRCQELVQNQLWVAWRLSGEAIDLAIARKGLGWVGIGIAEEQSGGMRGADIIVVSKVGDVLVAEDRFAEGFWHPLKDEQQDVELVSIGERNGIFQAVVRRPLLTCDVQDQAIRPDYIHRLLFAFGNDTDWIFQYHDSNNRGNAEIYFGSDYEKRTAMYDEALKDSSFEHMRIRFDNYHIPTVDRPSYGGKEVEGTNQYKCLAVPLAQVTNLTAPFDIVGAMPIVTSKYLHHFVNSACFDDPRPDPDLPWGQDQENDIFNCAMGGSFGAKCMNIRGWAQGGSGYVEPPDTGLRIVEGTTWIVFDTHYYNPSLDAYAFDSSGMDYMVTKKLRPRVAGSIWIGIDVAMRLPSGQKKAHHAQHCPAEAVDHLFSDGWDTVQIHRTQHHLHMRGRAARTYIVRDGYRIPLLLQDYYDYNFQGGAPLNVTLRRGDALEVHCTYDTSWDTSDVRWGERTQDEMCISITTFSPAPKKSTMFRCTSFSVGSALGSGTFTSIQWEGMEEELKLKIDNYHNLMHPTAAAATGCVKPADTCPAFMWSLCKSAAVCFTSEFCYVSGCTTEAPDVCKQAAACAPCFEPSGGLCESCENTCEPFLTELPGYLFNSTEIHKSIAYPIPDASGKYDLPWGMPLSPAFADYACKVVAILPPLGSPSKKQKKKGTSSKPRGGKKASKKPKQDADSKKAKGGKRKGKKTKRASKISTKRGTKKKAKH